MQLIDGMPAICLARHYFGAVKMLVLPDPFPSPALKKRVGSTRIAVYCIASNFSHTTPTFSLSLSLSLSFNEVFSQFHLPARIVNFVL
jgi:hypothetical protein